MPLKRSDRNLWLATLKSNGAIPLLLVALYFLGTFIENGERIDPYWARIAMLVGINITLAVSLQLINGVSGQFSLGHAGFMAVGAYLAGYATKTYGSITTPDDEVIDLANPTAVAAYFASLFLVLAVAGALLYGLFTMLRRSRRINPNLPAILMVVVFAWFVWDCAVAYGPRGSGTFRFWPWTIAMLGASFEWLTTNLTVWATSLNSVLPAFSRRPLTMLVALIGGGLAAAGAGLVVGLPTLRLRGDYLAIATLGFAEIIRIAIVNSQPLGGATGLNLVPYGTPADPDINLAAHYIFPWIYGIAAITAVVIWRIANSAKGRALQAVREDEIAAAAMGIDPTHHKVLAFVIGSFFAGVAGALYAHYDGYLHPSRFEFMRSIELVVMVTLGGLGSISGAILAAVVLTILPEVLRPIAEWRMVIYSLLLVIMMLVRPGGLLGRRELWPTRRRQQPGATAATPVTG